MSDQDLDSEALDEHMDDIEEQDEVRATLKMPDDLVGQGEDGEDIDFGDDVDDDMDEEGEAEMEENGSELQDKQEMDDELENDIFAMARENEEMKPEYAN